MLCWFLQVQCKHWQTCLQSVRAMLHNSLYPSISKGKTTLLVRGLCTASFPPCLFARAWLPGPKLFRQLYGLEPESCGEGAARSRFLPFFSWELLLSSDLHPWFLPKGYLQLCLSLTIASWLDLPAWPWTWLLYMDVSGDLDPWVTLVAVSGPHCFWHSLENLPVANRGTSFVFPMDRQPVCKVGPKWSWWPSQQVASHSLHLTIWFAQIGYPCAAWEADVSGSKPWAWFCVKGCIDIGKMINKAKWRESWVYSNIKYHNSSWFAWDDSTAVTI